MLVNHSRMDESCKIYIQIKVLQNSQTDETKHKCMGGVVLILHSNIVERYKL